MTFMPDPAAAGATAAAQPEYNVVSVEGPFSEPGSPTQVYMTAWYGIIASSS